MKTSRRAFTLIEILVVVAIIGLLAGLMFTNTDKIFGHSQEVVARVFVRDSLKTSLTRYRIDVGDYPSTADGLAALMTAPAAAADRWRGPYAEVPGGKIPLDPWGEPYQYRYPGTKNKGGYDLFSKGPDKTEGTEDDIGNW
ncbi:MAG: type II secretion system major pseudopilin GspG [Opitutales bacterium]